MQSVAKRRMFRGEPPTLPTVYLNLPVGSRFTVSRYKGIWVKPEFGNACYNTDKTDFHFFHGQTPVTKLRDI